MVGLVSKVAVEIDGLRFGSGVLLLNHLLQSFCLFLLDPHGPRELALLPLLFLSDLLFFVLELFPDLLSLLLPLLLVVVLDPFFGDHGLALGLLRLNDVLLLFLLLLGEVLFPLVLLRGEPLLELLLPHFLPLLPPLHHFVLFLFVLLLFLYDVLSFHFGPGVEV